MFHKTEIIQSWTRAILASRKRMADGYDQNLSVKRLIFSHNEENTLKCQDQFKVKIECSKS